MRKVITRTTLGLMFAGLCIWGVISHTRSEAQRESQEREMERQQAETIATGRRAFAAKRQQTEQSVARMVSVHNAVADWTDAFGGQRFAEKLPSEELAPALARSDGRPVLVFGSVVDVIAEGDGCKLEVDAKANLVSNVRFWLSCTAAQVKEAISHREEAHEEALDEIREEAVERGEEETTQEKQDDERQAKRLARQGFAVIARVDSVHAEESETADYPPTKTQFAFAQGRCLELLYVGRDFSMPSGDEAYLRLNTSEDETRARQEMLFRLTQGDIKKGSH